MGWKWLTLEALRLISPGARPHRAVMLLSISIFDTLAYATIREIAETLDMPVIVFSPIRDSRVMCASFVAGADEFICTPCAPDETIARLNAVLYGCFRHGAFTV